MPYCGTRMAGNTVMPRQPYYGPPQPVRQEDSGSMFGWGLLGFYAYGWINFVFSLER